MNGFSCRSSSVNDHTNSNSKGGDKTPMISAQGVRRITSDDTAVQATQGMSLPVAEFVTEIYDQPTAQSEHINQNDNDSIRVIEVVPDYSNDYFDTPSAQSFVTEENLMANSSVSPFASNDSTASVRALPVSNSITGDELLFRLKTQRKKATMRSGVIGGIIGMFILGPIGALGVGAGSALITKSRLKRREKALRRQLQGRLDQPLPVLSTPHAGTHCHCNHR